MPRTSKAATVLVVDDDEGLVILIAEALRETGREFITANSGQQALEALRHSRPQLMLLDLQLNDVTGKALLEQLKREQLLPPFIVITGQGDERVAVEMMKQGALDYLIKDTGMLDRLPQVVNRTLEQLHRDRELIAVQAALRESEQQMLAISEREQTRIGVELHDGLGQQLTALELMCHSLKEDLGAKQPALEKQVSLICQYLREAIAQTRALARGLAPVNLEATGLPDALAELARRTTEFGRTRCVFEGDGALAMEDSSVPRHLYRIAQEAVNNALKHAEATEIFIRLSEGTGAGTLEIADDGKGLPRTKKPGQGIGLQVMKHRAGMIGGTLEVESKPGKGVKITCVFPQKGK